MTTSPNTQPRVLLLHNFMSPYRVPLFTELANRFALDVWILGDVSRLREWRGDVPDGAFRYRTLPNRSVGLGSRYNRVLWNPSLIRDLKHHPCDAVICCGWDTPAAFTAAWFTRRSSVPFILWAGSTPAERTWIRTVTQTPVRWLVRRADSWIAYGSRAKDYLVSLGADDTRTHCAYNTVEIERFAERSRDAFAHRDTLRQQLGIKEKHVVLFCGNLLALKGLDDLIRGFARFTKAHRDVALLLVGSGEHEARYRALAQHEGIAGRTVFAGYRDRATLPEFYALADLLVLPSRSEVWGLVVNEALACGVPVAASDAVGAAPDLIEPGVNGYVFPARSPEHIAGVFERHFSPTADRAAMAEAARTGIERFTVAAMADAFEAAVSKAIRMRPR